MSDVSDWVLEGEGYIEYRARLDLLGQSEGTIEVDSARRRMLQDPKIQALIVELKGWPGQVLSSHKSAGQHYHKLAFLADLGLTKRDAGVDEVAQKIFAHQSAEGAFQLPTNIPKHFGGAGEDTWGWALCDAPITVYALAKLGYGDDPRVQKAAGYLAGLAFPNGFHCTVSKELGRFRGPGRKDDPCPYATLVELKMLGQFEELRHGSEAHTAAECLLNLWQNSRSMHPYIFYMGTDFRKLKAPFVWYDVLHVLDVLSQFSWLKGDPRLVDMASVVGGKADAKGRFTAESVWQAWGDWEFAQKKQPSRWLTLLALRALKKLSQS